MGGFMHFLNHWWNLPFLVMLAIVLIYFLLQLVGMVGDHGDGDGGHDHDVDGHDGEHGFFGEALHFLGVGNVPFLVVWTTFFIAAGFAGLAFNRIVWLSLGGTAPAWLLPASLGVALVAGLAATAVAGRLVGKALDVSGSRATSKKDLTGRFGVVASVTLDGAFGEVRVHDGEHEILVHGRTQGGEAAIGRGARVVLVDYDESRDLYWVTVSPEEEQEGKHVGVA